MFARYILLGALAISSTCMMAVGTASAHHSTTIYDLRARVVMTGTVKEYHWTQPHAFVILTVPKPTGAEEWNIEIGTPSVNAGMGWKMNDIKVGDTLTMTVHPVRTGAKHATASIVKLADGRTLYGPAAGLAGLLPRP